MIRVGLADRKMVTSVPRRLSAGAKGGYTGFVSWMRRPCATPDYTRTFEGATTFGIAGGICMTLNPWLLARSGRCASLKVILAGLPAR
jgi:hypothetical protein